MDDPLLEQLLADLESPRSERKETLSEPDRVGQAICAVRDAKRIFEKLARDIANRAGIDIG